MADARLLFDIVARDNASGAFKSAGSSSDNLKSKLGSLAKLAGGALVASFGKASVDAFKESEKAQSSLQAAFAKSPALVGANLKAIEDLNSALAKKTKFDDDATASGQAVLAGFNLTADQISQLTPLLQDYATRTGKDLPTAASDLGKAVLGQGKALKKIGIDFKDTGTEAGNFGSLVDLLSSKVGGFAEKEGKTAAGQAAIMSNQFGELQEKVGSVLVPVLSKLAGVLADVFGWMSDLSPGAQKLLGVVAGLAGTVFLIVKASQAWVAVQGALNVVLAANPIGLVVIAIAALVAGLVLAYKNSETFRNIVQAVFGAVKAYLTPAILAFQGLGIVVGEVVGFIKSHFDDVVTTVTGLPGRIARAASGMWNGIKTAFRAALNFVIRAWNAIEFKIPGFKIGPIGYDGFTLGVPDIPLIAAANGFTGVVSRPTLFLAGEDGAEGVNITPGGLPGVGRGEAVTIEQHFHGQHDSSRAQREAAREFGWTALNLKLGRL
jgi:hypothetical protein